MPLSPQARQRALFIVLCLVWGTTWLALKAGAMAVPPGFFSGTRWTIAGLVLLVWRRWRGNRERISFGMVGRLTAVAVLLIPVNATIQLYGLRYVGSGLAAVINAGLTPISLLGFSIALRQEKFSPRQGAAILVGVVGILLLFGPSAVTGAMDWRALLGAGGVIVACLSYAAGSVLARPLMRTMAPAELAAVTNFMGGMILLVLSLLFEPGVGAALTGAWGAAAWAAWWYLLVPGSLGATIIYFLLVRDWGASRTGTYAFVSPVIAVALGILVYHEQLHVTDAMGMVLMLTAAGLVLRPEARARSLEAESPASVNRSFRLRVSSPPKNR